MTPPNMEKAGKPSDAEGVFSTLPNIEQQQQKTGINKKYKYFAVAVIISAVVITAGVLGSVALYKRLNRPQEFNTETLFRGQHIPEHAYVDYDRRITYVNNTRYGTIRAGNHLHDYNKHLLVFKDVEKKVCYVDILNGTFEEGVTKLAQKRVTVPTPVKYVEISKEPIDERILRKFAGDAIADHCKGIPAYWTIDSQSYQNSSGQGCKETDIGCRDKRAVQAEMACHTVILIFWWPW